MFLTPEELQQLTGLRQNFAQIRWLTRQGIRHRVRADGKPVVMASDLTQTQTTEQRTGPRFDRIAG